MPPNLHIRNLLNEPFGPYPEDDILGDGIRKGTVLDIKSFSMECGRLPIGFDESEFIGLAPPRSRIIRKPVFFYAKLVIKSLDWLSDQGKRWLEKDLRQRDEHLNFHHAAKSGLTLARLYGDVKNQGSRITVWIQGEKNMHARFMTEPHQQSLIIHSKKSSDTVQYKSRMYNVLSLDVGTFETSQDFLQRYRLWALIDEIIKTDPAKTPLEDRTIDWLVDNYINRFIKRDLYRRIIFDTDNDSDVDVQGTTSKKRYLRHVPRSEIVGIFAAHADWLLAQQLAPNSSALRKVNIPKWIAFCRRVKTARRDAWRNEVRWGLPYGCDSDDADDDDTELDLSRFGNTQEFWNKRILRALQIPKPKPKARSPSIENAIVVRRRRVLPSFIYDSDFSEPSTSSASDSDDDGPTPIVANAFRFPEIPAGCFEWRCPECHYSLDMLAIAADINNGNRRPSWKFLNQDCVQDTFRKIVSDHCLKNHVRWVQRKKRKVLPVKIEPSD